MSLSPPTGLNGFHLESFEKLLTFCARALIPARHQAKLSVSDLVQETFRKATKAQETFRGKTQAEAQAWLCQILRNTFFDWVQLRHMEDISLNDIGDRSPENLLRIFRLPETSVASRLAKMEIADILVNALSELPEEEMNVLIFQYWQGLKIREIAEIMHRSEPAVSKLRKRAVLRLNALLAPSYK